MTDPVSGSVEPEDAEHIAGWDPVVALAVAAWLNLAADDLAVAGGDRSQCSTSHAPTCATPTPR